MSATLTPVERQKMVSRVTDKGQNLNKQIQNVPKAFHIPNSQCNNKEKTHNCIKKNVENLFFVLLAKKIMSTLPCSFYFHAKPQPCIFPKALGRLCKTKLLVFHALMVCHPPSDVHMGCSYTCRVVQFEHCMLVLTTSVDYLKLERLKRYQFGVLTAIKFCALKTFRNRAVCDLISTEII